MTKPIWHEWFTRALDSKASGYRVYGGKVNHHAWFNRRSAGKYFDQRFDGAYQDQLSRGQDVSISSGQTGRMDPSVKALTQPPKNHMNSTGASG